MIALPLKDGDPDVPLTADERAAVDRVVGDAGLIALGEATKTVPFAVAGEKGIPSESRGTIAPAVAALLAASGAATPSMTPVPNFSGVRDTFFSTL